MGKHITGVCYSIQRRRVGRGGFVPLNFTVSINFSRAEEDRSLSLGLYLKLVRYIAER